jgi:hypothetical protein
VHCCYQFLESSPRSRELAVGCLHMHYGFKVVGRAGGPPLGNCPRHYTLEAVLVRLEMLFVIRASVLPCDSKDIQFLHSDLYTACIISTLGRLGSESMDT